MDLSPQSIPKEKLLTVIHLGYFKTWGRPMTYDIVVPIGVPLHCRI